MVRLELAAWLGTDRDDLRVMQLGRYCHVDRGSSDRHCDLVMLGDEPVCTHPEVVAARGDVVESVGSVGRGLGFTLHLFQRDDGLRHRLAGERVEQSSLEDDRLFLSERMRRSYEREQAAADDKTCSYRDSESHERPPLEREHLRRKPQSRIYEPNGGSRWLGRGGAGPESAKVQAVAREDDPASEARGNARIGDDALAGRDQGSQRPERVARVAVLRVFDGRAREAADSMCARIMRDREDRASLIIPAELVHTQKPWEQGGYESYPSRRQPRPRRSHLVQHRPK